MKQDTTCPTCGLYWTREGNEDCPRCDTCNRLRIEQLEGQLSEATRQLAMLDANLAAANRICAAAAPPEVPQPASELSWKTTCVHKVPLSAVCLKCSAVPQPRVSEKEMDATWNEPEVPQRRELTAEEIDDVIDTSHRRPQPDEPTRVTIGAETIEIMLRRMADGGSPCHAGNLVTAANCVAGLREELRLAREVERTATILDDAMYDRKGNLDKLDSLWYELSTALAALTEYRRQNTREKP
jgi:hypothetical protein